MVMGGKYVGPSKFVKKSVVMMGSLVMAFFISSAEAS
jgi:hypothetical protein